MAREVKITVRGVPREQPDLRRLARALLAAAQAEQQRVGRQQPPAALADGEEAAS